MKKKNKLQVIKETHCLNCGHPFFGSENFCPECGQSNKDKRITFIHFIDEVFNGFISWDAKFWTTIIPLLISPGKVSKDYIDGKRQRYTNPFRFYLMVSVLFFLIIGAADSYSKFNEFRQGKSEKTIANTIKGLSADSLQKKSDANLNKALNQMDSIDRQKVLKSVKQANLSDLKPTNNGLKLNLGNNKFNRFMEFQKKNPNASIDEALDSLQIEKTFTNRFLYNRAEAINNLTNSKDGFRNLKKQFFSYISISLFVLLPLFTLFLKLYYIRSKYTYVEHLVFVFHTQTVFFLMLILFFILNFFNHSNSIIGIFFILFLLYLFLAMKKFYGQGYMKTFFKYILANTTFFFLSIIGMTIISIAAFAFY